MEIKNIRVYELEESILASGYPHQIGEPAELNFDTSNFKKDNLSQSSIDRAIKLSKTPPSSGHANFRKGILVSFDLKYPQYISPQLQRYNWITIVSSQSKMHTLTKIDNLINRCNKFVLERIASEVDCLIEIYNQNEFPYTYNVWSTCYEGNKDIIIKNREECFQYIISNTPLGFELWMRVTTNYEQLATIYTQRKSHKLYDWKEFGEFIEKLPLSNELIC